MSLLYAVGKAAIVGLAAVAPLGIVFAVSWRYRARSMDRLGRRRFVRAALTRCAAGFAATAILSALAQLRGRLAISGVLAVVLTILVGRGLFGLLAQPKARPSSATSCGSEGTDSSS